jgi:hypothetical protein
MKTPRPIDKTCNATKSDGSNCQAAALSDSDFCYFHDPTQAQKRKEGQAEGGRQQRLKTLDVTVPDVNVEDCGDAIALISETINQVRKGKIDPRVANSVGFLANILIKAVERNKLEARIEHLESLVKAQSSTSGLNIMEE